ncbi:GGDEF domain-containing protein [Allosphingosinicella indica]|uniref:diguanylate cyclase n=1 Tax=Allosphingosinicella indica TaxID=941907 RepID=A0A1X7FZJ2_9SPHN|nr:GGDEF domain-containing protein [Allosphingosinicella indica]SMF61501.1 diguanylate cyclase [Allosphingosinicella indica]
MSDDSVHEKAQRRAYKDIGAFLEQHRLDINPANYALVYWVVTQSNPDAVEHVTRLTGDGLRLTQAEADRIMALVGEDAPRSGAPAIQIEAIQAQVARFAELVDQTRASTESYGRDLEAQADELAGARPDTALADLVRLTSAMIARTRDAERALDEATGEAAALRDKLEEAREEASHDVLTGLPNRRAFEARYEVLAATGEPISVAICDIDLFKSINDSHGHAVGDRVLKAVAGDMRDTCEGHFVGRLGGEEFVILIAGMKHEAACALVDAARLAVADRKFRVRETDRPIGTVTFSAGVARRGMDEPRETALGRADALLYRAKENGRNRIECD